MSKLFTGLAIAGAVALSASAASAQTVLRVANWLPPKHPLVADIIVPWAEQVKEATDGRVVLELLEAPLGPPPAHFDFAVNGIADVTYGVHNYTPGRFTATELAEVPFLADKSEDLSVAYWRIHERMLEQAGEHAGTKVLSVFTHGPGHLWTKGRDLTSIDGIKGSKIRIGGGVAQEVAKALELVPVQAPVTSAYELLSGGVADGIQFPAESVTFFNIHNVVDSGLVADGGLYNVSFFVVMNEGKWNGLSKEDQDAIMSVSGEALARMAGKAWDAADATAYEAIEAKGIQIVRPDDATKAELESRLAPVTDATLSKIAAKGIDAKGALAALRAEIEKVQAGN